MVVADLLACIGQQSEHAEPQANPGQHVLVFGVERGCSDNRVAPVDHPESEQRAAGALECGVRGLIELDRPDISTST
ncbi:hypothetical protein P3L18_05375 [Gordonia sp. N1V]|nr:hypothetical protein [Gordonia sp. N1V]